MKAVVLNVAYKDGTYPVIAESFGPLAVHNYVKDAYLGFVVTHVKTGRSLIPDPLPLLEARKCANDLQHLDWDFLDANPPEATKQAFLAYLAKRRAE